jgi:hypothetical protein
VLGFLCLGSVGEHQEAERLAVRTARPAGGGEQDRAQRFRRDGLVAIAADRSRRREAFEQANGVSGQIWRET